MSDDHMNNVPAPLFEVEASKTVRTFGRNHEMRVVFQGDEPVTMDNVIVFPSLDQTKPLSHAQVMVGRGYVDHEGAHVLHTDMPLFSQVKQAAWDRGDKLFAMALNALEDVRIEKIVTDVYPGAAKNLTAATEEVIDHFDREYGGDTEIWSDFQRIGPLAVTWVGRQKMGYASPKIDAAVAKLDANLRAKAQRWVDMLGMCRGLVQRTDANGQEVIDGKPGTEDVVNLTRRVVKEMRDEHRQQQQQKQQQKQGGQGQPNQGSGGQGGANSSQRNKDTKAKQEGKAGQGQGEEPQGQGQGQAGEEQGQQGQGGQGGQGGDEEAPSQGQDGSSGGGNSPQNNCAEGEEQGQTGMDHNVGGGHGGGDFSAATYEDNDFDTDAEPISCDLDLKQAFASHMGHSKGIYRPFTRAHDKWHTRHDQPGKYKAADGYGDYTLGQRLTHPSGDVKYQNVLTLAQGKVNVMRRKLERALLSTKMRDWEDQRPAGRLDTKRLVQAVKGHENVFKMRKEAPDVDTAVTVLIDLSGSMDGEKISLAQQAAICLAEALEKTGVAYEVLGFQCATGVTDKQTATAIQMARNGYDENGNRKPGLKSDYSRWTCIDMWVFKDFEERLRTAKRAMGAIASACGGNNCDGESVMYAYERLRHRPEKKKIMLVLSDGFPATATSFGTEHLYQHLRNVVQYVSKKVKCVGIGIMSEAVKQFYPRYVVLEDLDGLSKNVLDQVGKMILGERFVVDNADLLKVNDML